MTSMETPPKPKVQRDSAQVPPSCLLRAGRQDCYLVRAELTARDVLASRSSLRPGLALCPIPLPAEEIASGGTTWVNQYRQASLGPNLIFTQVAPRAWQTLCRSPDMSCCGVLP